MNELFMDPFATHVYKAMLNTLSGYPQKNLNEERVSRKRKTVHDDDDTVYRTPTTFEDLLRRFLGIVSSWDNALLQTMAFDKYAVPLLQAIIETDVPRPTKKSKIKPGNRTIGEMILFGNGENLKGRKAQFSTC